MIGNARAELHGGGGARRRGEVANVLPQSLVEVILVDGEGEHVAGDGLHGEHSSEDGTSSRASPSRIGGTHGGGEIRAGLVREPRPGDAVGGLVVSVKANGGVEALADWVPHHRRRRIADGVWELVGLNDLSAVFDGRQLPAHARVRGVIQAEGAGVAPGPEVHRISRFGYGCNDEIRAGSTPGESCKCASEEVVGQSG